MADQGLIQLLSEDVWEKKKPYHNARRLATREAINGEARQFLIWQPR